MNKILQIFRRPELRNKVLFILRCWPSQLMHNIPIPAVDTTHLRDFLNQNQLFSLVSTFTGGSLSTPVHRDARLSPLHHGVHHHAAVDDDLPVAGADV